ncbi:MAG: putative zinc-binding protein [Desulfomonilaceae bacterium]
MSNECCSSAHQIMLLPCSGASNLEQLANQAAVELTREGYGKMFCLAAIGAGLPNFVKSAQTVPQLVAIDGCQVACTKHLLNKADVPIGSYLVVQDLGIEKNMNTVLDPAQVEKVKEAVKNLGAQPCCGASQQSSGSTCCG